MFFDFFFSRAINLHEVFTDETIESFPSMNQVINDSLTEIGCTIAEVKGHLSRLNINRTFVPVSPHIFYLPIHFTWLLPGQSRERAW